MSDNDELPREPPRSYQLPDWETPINPHRRSLLGRLMTPMRTGAPTSKRSPGGTGNTSADEALAKETLGTLPTHTTSLGGGSTSPPRQSLGARLAARFDAVLPPHKTYLGRLRRRAFLLFVVLPAALLLLLAFVLGLALGLRARASSGVQDLPLPTDTGGIYTGDLTYFTPALGACGVESTVNSYICAVSHLVFDAAQTGSNPNANPLCGRKIRIERDYVEIGAGNRTVDVTVVDRCVGCREYDLDLAPIVFDQLAPESEGRVLGSWSWLPAGS